MGEDAKETDEAKLAVLGAMREAFAGGRYQEVLARFGDLGDPKTTRSGIRVEAIALASRSHIALDDKQAARQNLKHVWNAPLKHHRHCRHVAIACLELGEYRRAAELSERAAQMVDAAKSPTP